MSGKICNGVATDQPDIRESRAYCEGRASAAGGGTFTAFSADTGVVANNNALTWTGKTTVAWTIALVDPSANNRPLHLHGDSAARTLTVSLATGAGGAITTTGAQLLAAVQADPHASRTFGIANTGASTGAGAVVAESVTQTGGVVPLAAPTSYDDSLSWVRGFGSWAANPAGAGAPPGGKDCCAHAYGGGFS